MTVTVHIGYHKTATTWMQRDLFLPRYGYCQLLTHEEVHETITGPHGLQFSADFARDLIAKRQEGSGGLHAEIISSELLCGNPFYGGRESDVFASRLKEIIPSARILITIRHQPSILVSTYLQYLSRGGTKSISSFYNERSSLGYYGFSPAHFEYHRLLKHYRDLFGNANVLVMTFEELSRDPANFITDVARFAGVPLGSSPDGLAIRKVGSSAPDGLSQAIRYINFLRNSPTGSGPILGNGRLGDWIYRAATYGARHRPLSSALNSYHPVEQYVKSRFAGRFADSNSELRLMIPEKSKWLQAYE